MPGFGGQKYTDLPLSIIGSTKFGRYPFMSSEQTYNMIMSDNYSVPFAGFKRAAVINPSGFGRGIYSSVRLNKMFAVVDNGIYTFEANLTPRLVGNTTTVRGDVFISENNNTTNGGEVAFSDSRNLYIYKQNTNSVDTLVNGVDIDFTPGYLSYQNGRFISPDLASNQWRLSDINQSTVGHWPTNSRHVGLIQTKPTRAVACIRFPSKGNLLLVFGNNIAEHWYDVGAQLFPYQRSQSTNIDYGCLNPATIAESEEIVAWLGINEKSGPTIMFSTGGDVNHLSTDGIDFKLATLVNPANSYGFMFKQDGHLFYVITFVDDNLTYAYDFNTNAFYTLSDQNLNYFPARRVAFFNDQYYFVSIDDGNLYQLGSQFTNYDYGDGHVHEIPRVRICPEIRQADQSYFVTGYTGFKIESGITRNTQRVDFRLSKNSGVSYGNVQSITLPVTGHYQNRLMFWNQGISNTLVPQFRFYGFDRFIAADGVVGIYQ